MNRERRAVLRTLAQAAIVALPGPAILLRAGSDAQPLAAQARRVIDAFAYLGEPFSDEALAPFRAAETIGDETAMIDAIERLFARRCLVAVRINPEGRVSLERGPADARLVEQGWRAFIVKVRNEAGTTARLAMDSPQARPVYRPATANAFASPSVGAPDIAARWPALDMFDDKPLEPQLSGLTIEYRIATLYSRDRGKREAQIGATAGGGSDDIGFRNRVAIVFSVDPS